MQRGTSRYFLCLQYLPIPVVPSLVISRSLPAAVFQAADTSRQEQQAVATRSAAAPRRRLLRCCRCGTALQQEAFSEHTCGLHFLPGAALHVSGLRNQCVVCAAACTGTGCSKRRCTVVIDAAALSDLDPCYKPASSLRDFLVATRGSGNRAWHAAVQSWMLEGHSALDEHGSSKSLNDDLLAVLLEVRFTSGQMTVHALQPISREQTVLQYACRPVGSNNASTTRTSAHPDVFAIIIDGRMYTAADCGNAAMLIDHACPPANNLKTANLGDDRVLFRAARDIRPGEKLTFDYLEDEREKGLQLDLGFDCHCDACMRVS